MVDDAGKVRHATDSGLFFTCGGCEHCAAGEEGRLNRVEEILNGT